MTVPRVFRCAPFANPSKSRIYDGGATMGRMAVFRENCQLACQLPLQLPCWQQQTRDISSQVLEIIGSKLLKHSSCAKLRLTLTPRAGCD